MRNIDISLGLILLAITMHIYFSLMKMDGASVILLSIVMAYLYLERRRSNHYLSQLMQIVWSPDKE